MSSASDEKPVAGTVADEMAAIFGSARRDDAVPPPPRLAATRRGGRSGLIAATVAGVAALIGVGSVFVGQSVVGNPVLGPSPADRERSVGVPQLHRAAPTSEVAVPAAAADIRSISPSAVIVAGESDARPVRAVASAELVPPLAQPAEPVEVIAPVASDVVAAAEVTRPSPPSCEDDDSCIAVQLDAAERQLAGAYREAAASGVRASDLRDYRGEWLRARREADYRPRAALRVYGMILADLDTLTGDAVARRAYAQR